MSKIRTKWWGPVCVTLEYGPGFPFKVDIHAFSPRHEIRLQLDHWVVDRVLEDNLVSNPSFEVTTKGWADGV